MGFVLAKQLIYVFVSIFTGDSSLFPIKAKGLQLNVIIIEVLQRPLPACTHLRGSSGLCEDIKNLLCHVITAVKRKM